MVQLCTHSYCLETNFNDSDRISVVTRNYDVLEDLHAKDITIYVALRKYFFKIF